MRPALEVADIVRAYGDEFRQAHAASLSARQTRCRELLGVVAPPTEPQWDYRERYRQLTGEDPLRCPQCRIGQLLRIAVLPAQVRVGCDSS